MIVDGFDNTVSVADALIGSGTENTIFGSGANGVIGGGNQNHLSAKFGFIGAGTNNTVSGEGAYIAAGGYNTASGAGAVIDGGYNSTAAGTFATIPGGYVNSAGGTYSFAAGARASAAQTGTFVWSDGSDGDAILTSARAYQFLARASGGVTFWTNAASTVGAQLAPGSGTWASASDRNLKTDVARIDDATVLDKVAALPIGRWSYKSERGVRHVGPMAQDFYAAFKVGEDDKHITSIDEDGIALAAIKALHARIGELDAENAQLRARLASTDARLRARLASTDARLARLSAAVAAMTTR
ncbi:MAG TPA: tail fiber domain-containing protein [Candidatus Elarobacter sp.]|nr:tail fiber domain-containing protein [Candidatus Elarobacter sp.]